MENVNRLGPELILLAIAGIILLADIVIPRRALLTFAALGATLASILWTGLLIATDQQGEAFSGVLVVDEFSIFFNFLFAGIAFVVILASQDYGEHFRGRETEYQALVLTTAASMMLLAGSRDLIAIFLALELTSISFYIMAAFLKDSTSAEAALKYLLLGAVSSAVTLYGMAFLFGLAGTTNLEGIAVAVSEAADDNRVALVMAVVLLTAGFGFKMALVPFQMWVPDVYDGAPTPVAAYLSVGSKAAGFAVVMRIFFEALGDRAISEDWSNLFAVIAAITMSVGNILAITQTNIKRLMGYSSIAQAGYFAVGLAAVSAGDDLGLGASGLVFFLAAYAFTNLAAFVAIIAISNRIGSDNIADYAGIAKRSPLVAFVLVLAMLSLIGIPPTAGFVAKIFIFNAAVQSDLVWLVLVGVLNSLVSAYYYLRVVLQMFAVDSPAEGRLSVSPAMALALTTAVAGVLVVGILPFPLIEASEEAARALLL
jgi:NADH-quinone oxidoreductase subunit N